VTREAGEKSSLGEEFLAAIELHDVERLEARTEPGRRSTKPVRIPA